MSGCFATPDFLFAHFDKTGSSTVKVLLRLLYDPKTQHTSFARFLGQGGLPEGYEHLPVVSTIRNPFTYFVSYWLYFKDDSPAELSPYSSFEEWVRNCPSAYLEKYKMFVPDDVKMIRLESQQADFIRVMKEVGAPLTVEIEKQIKTTSRVKVNLEREKRYRDYYDDSLIDLVLNHNALIFDLYYPDRQFPRED